MLTAARPASVLALLLLGHSLLHVLLGWMLGLSADEAQYALGADRLAPGYPAHPPLVAWLQWPLVAPGLPEGLLRLLPQALWVLTALLIHDIAQRLHTLLVPAVGTAAQAGLWAVGAFSLAPLPHLLGIALLPEGLLMFCTVALLWQTLRLLDALGPRGRHDWLLLGALLGLAVLASDLAALAVLPVAGVLLATHGPGLLRRRGPWLALLVMLLLALPNLAWNLLHGGGSWQLALRQAAAALGGDWGAARVLLFLLVQLLMYPLLLWGITGLRHAVRGGFEIDRAQAWLLAFFALPLLVLAVLSGGGAGLTLTPAPGWAALAPFAGVGLAALWAGGRRVLVAGCAVAQGLATLVLYLLLLLAGPPWLSSAGPEASEPEASNPFANFYGWEEAGSWARQLAYRHNIPRLAVQGRVQASRLAWYARPLPVHVLAPPGGPLAGDAGPLPPGASAVLLDWSQQPFQLPVGEGLFQRCEPVQGIEARHAGRMVAHFRFSLCYGWGGQPAPRARDAIGTGEATR